MGGTKKYQNIMYIVQENIQDGIGYLSSFDSFLHAQSIILLLSFFLVLKMIEANCRCLRQIFLINHKPQRKRLH